MTHDTCGNAEIALRWHPGEVEAISLVVDKLAGTLHGVSTVRVCGAAREIEGYIRNIHGAFKCANAAAAATA